jgi:hypothetical protein
MTYRTLIMIACIAVLPRVDAHGPSRQKVTESIVVNAPATRVWELVGGFCAIADWHPGVHRCDASGTNAKGTTRILTIGADDGPQIHEELLKFDADKMTYKYKVTKTDNNVLPVITYSAFFTVKDNGDNSTLVEWRSGFYRAFPNGNPPPELNDEAAVKAVTGSYRAGLAEIKRLAEQAGP